MIKAIIYDFDKTIYSKETSIEFIKFFLKKYPKYIPKFLLNLCKIIPNIHNLKKTKNIFFSILKDLDLTPIINEFWKKEIKNIYPYFSDEIKNNKKEAQKLILISASPDFLLEKLYKDLGFDILIATKYVDYKMEGKNCKGIEKVNRLNELGNFEILKFYSDSLSDKPIFDLAKEKITIKNGKKIKGLPKKNGLIDRWL